MHSDRCSDTFLSRSFIGRAIVVIGGIMIIMPEEEEKKKKNGAGIVEK
jgi:hypothetical protein